MYGVFIYHSFQSKIKNPSFTKLGPDLIQVPGWARLGSPIVAGGGLLLPELLCLEECLECGLIFTL